MQQALEPADDAVVIRVGGPETGGIVLRILTAE